MKITYTIKPNNFILINKIEASTNWEKIEEEYGPHIRYEYFDKYPFYFHNDESVHIYTRNDDTVSLIPVRVGEEYSKDYFDELKKLISEADRRLENLKKYSEEQWIWDSSNNINILIK